MGNERKGRGQRGARRAARCNDGRDERVLSVVQSKESVVRKKRRPSARRATFRESGAAWPKKSAVHGGQRALLSCMLVATALVGSACHGLLRHAAFHASRRSKFGALLTPRFFKVSRPMAGPPLSMVRARVVCTRRAAGTLPRRLPLWWRTPRTTLRLGHTRGARHAPRTARTQRAPRSSPRIAPRTALHRAPRATPRHAAPRTTRVL